MVEVVVVCVHWQYCVWVDSLLLSTADIATGEKGRATADY